MKRNRPNEPIYGLFSKSTQSVFIVAFTYLLAPIGLVLLTESFQPIFVFMLGIFFTFFIPKVATEKIYARHILQKVLAICITAIGTYLLLK